MGTTGKI
ncbi:unnamed protein product, partial [Rotaria sordida]